ncbi:hypothetical protein C8F01DRAFT_1183339 [Mycena amicta]|nr:hypothetical protein C8F01DRAFT_1183339 [Mycena amicta]
MPKLARKIPRARRTACSEAGWKEHTPIRCDDDKAPILRWLNSAAMAPRDAEAAPRQPRLLLRDHGEERHQGSGGSSLCLHHWPKTRTSTQHRDATSTLTPSAASSTNPRRTLSTPMPQSSFEMRCGCSRARDLQEGRFNVTMTEIEAGAPIALSDDEDLVEKGPVFVSSDKAHCPETVIRPSPVQNECILHRFCDLFRPHICRRTPQLLPFSVLIMTLLAPAPWNPQRSSAADTSETALLRYAKEFAKKGDEGNLTNDITRAHPRPSETSRQIPD